MTATYIAAAFGAIAFVICAWGYVQAMQMASANRRLNLNGSTGMTVRTIKRREVIHMLKCFVIIYVSVYAGLFLQKQPTRTWPAELVLMVRSGGFATISFLIALNTIWDIFDRRNTADMRIHERDRLRVQKRQTDPAPGAILPEEDLTRLTLKEEGTDK